MYVQTGRVVRRLVTHSEQQWQRGMQPGIHHISLCWSECRVERMLLGYVKLGETHALFQTAAQR